MSEDGDPLAAATDGDLYEIADWEPRSVVDRVLVGVTRLVSLLARAGVILLGVVLLLGIGAFAAVTDPVIGLFTALSAIPALALAAYVYLADVTADEPPTMLAVTFLLGIVTATFAAVINSFADPLLSGLGVLGVVLLYFVVVGPVEESVKLLAVWLYAYRDERFAAVIDGAVYGAMAGLGFAFIENALYISRGIGPDPLGPLAAIQMGASVTFVRALAGPGHVIYSAFAGYYLGLAKFVPEYRVPIVLKGIGTAALIHALYNTTVNVVPGLLTLLGVPSLVAVFLYILAFDGVFALLLVRKLRRYRDAYAEATAGEVAPIPGFTAAPESVREVTAPDVSEVRQVPDSAETESAVERVESDSDDVAEDAPSLDSLDSLGSTDSEDDGE